MELVPCPSSFITPYQSLASFLCSFLFSSLLQSLHPMWGLIGHQLGDRTLLSKSWHTGPGSSQEVGDSHVSQGNATTQME